MGNEAARDRGAKQDDENAVIFFMHEWFGNRSYLEQINKQLHELDALCMRAPK